MKTLADAESIRAKVLKAFETAEIEEDPSKHQDLLTFVLVGAGPTGVEMAGALAELRRFTLKSDFRRIDPLTARIILAQAGPRILANFPEELSRKAKARLESVGVEVRLGQPVKAIDEAHVVIGDETIPCRTVIWTAGVAPSPAGKWLNAPPTRPDACGLSRTAAFPDIQRSLLSEIQRRTIKTASLCKELRRWRCSRAVTSAR